MTQRTRVQAISIGPMPAFNIRYWLCVGQARSDELFVRFDPAPCPETTSLVGGLADGPVERARRYNGRCQPGPSHGDRRQTLGHA